MPLESSPAFQFYVKEWRSSRAVMRMSFAQRGMYLEMLCEQWENLSLPDNPDQVAELVGGTVEEWREHWAVLRRNFLLDESTGRIKNSRLARCRTELRRFKQISRKGGLARAKSATRRQDGTYSPAEEPAALQPSASTASASSTASSTATAKKERECAEPLRDSSPTVVTFPTIGSGPKSWALTESQIAEWLVAYPGVEVLGECQKALAWVRANQPKTARGMPAFLVRWLNTCVNRGPRARTFATTGTEGRGRTGAPPKGKYDGIEES